jgi:hypothetical protein
MILFFCCRKVVNFGPPFPLYLIEMQTRLIVVRGLAVRTLRLSFDEHDKLNLAVGSLLVSYIATFFALSNNTTVFRHN